MKKIVVLLGLCLVLWVAIDLIYLGPHAKSTHTSATDLIVLADYYGYEGVDEGEGSNVTISLHKGEYRVDLTVVAETPASLRFYKNGIQTKELTYQGHGADHQFSEQALERSWEDHRIYMNQQEYDDFLDALAHIR